MLGEARTELNDAVTELVAPPALETGRRRWMTVLVCDIVGSTRLSFDLTPYQLRGLMLQYYACSTEVVEAHHGTVLRYIGDGVLSVFGLDGRSPEDASNALRAAHEVIERVSQIPVLLAEGPGQHLAIRVSAATGWVVTGEWIGHGPARQEGLFGAAPYLAAGLNRMAEPNGTVVCDCTYEAARGDYTAHRLGNVTIKGRRYETGAWRVARRERIVA